MLWLWTSKLRLLLLAGFWWWYTPCAQEEKQSGKPPIQPDHDDAAIFAPAESCSAGLHINCYALICSNTYLLPLLTFEAETPLSAMLFWMVSRSRWSRISNELFLELWLGLHWYRVSSYQHHLQNFWRTLQFAWKCCCWNPAAQISSLLLGFWYVSCCTFAKDDY